MIPMLQKSFSNSVNKNMGLKKPRQKQSREKLHFIIITLQLNNSNPQNIIFKFRK